MADMVFPGWRHDRQPWRASDQCRRGRSGEPLAMRSIIMFLKGDWSEFASSLGLPTWGDGCRPCFLCNACGDGLYCHKGASRIRFPSRENREGEYDEACDRCMLEIEMTGDKRKALLEQGGLQYDKRPNGSHGLALGNDVPTLGLVRGDRVEPSPALPDVGQLERLDLRNRPRIVFWRPSRETLAKHKNPLFCARIGLTVQRSLAPDTLHTLYLGVFLAFCRMVVWRLILAGAWGGMGPKKRWWR